MKNKNNLSILFTIFMVIFLFAGCPPRREEISSKDPDPASIMDVTFIYEDDSSHRRELPVNQIVLLFDEDVTSLEARNILADMEGDMRGVGLTLVGQIPALGIYQLEVENENSDPQEAINALDLVIEALRGYDRVDTVSYNELLELRFMENDDDMSSLNGRDRCPYAVIDYYQAIPIFDEVLPSVTLNPVTVAIIDSGLWFSSGQFDEVGPRISNLDSPGVETSDYHPRKHGTSVASIIAGDNRDGMINGIALRALGDNLHLQVSRATLFGDRVHMHWVLAGARLAVENGAGIVNLSLGAHDEGRTPPWLIRMQRGFMRLFNESESHNVLFVAAASGDGFRLDNNDVPAGLPADNLITVGGVESCDFQTIYAASSTGPGIDIAAPATRITTCCLGDDMVGPIINVVEGNSFAVPIVTSIAAIILSIDPDLTGAQLKDFLTDDNHVWPAPEEVGGKRVALIKAVGSALLSTASSSSVDTIMDVFGGVADNIPDPSGHMINRLCGSVEFEVTGPSYSQHHILNAADLVYGLGAFNFGIIGSGDSVFSFYRGRDSLSPFTDTGFRLNHEYPIVPGGPNGFLLSAGAPGGGDYIGFSESGSIIYTECELTTRSLPLDWFSPDLSGPHQQVFIEVAGRLNPSTARGTVETGGEREDNVIYNVSGNFTMAFSLMYPDAATLEHLEEVCEGGYEYSP